MKVAVIICRILLGLGFTVFGLSKLLPYHPPMPPGDPGAWSTLMIHHHWMTVVGTFETVGGLLVLSGRFVPLGLALLAPVCVNVLLFGFFFLPATLISGGLVSFLELFLLFAYRSYFAPLFTARAEIS